MRAATDADGTFRTKRREGVPALHISAFDRAEDWEREFLAGCELLGFGPTPQQWKIADAVNAHREDFRPLFTTMGVCVPRRAGKTTALLALALGRCKMRENYVVLFTAQSGTKARDRFLDMARILERKWPNEYERGFRILKGAGHQVVEFANGSFFQVVPPKQDSFRGDAGDLIILDEAQEHDAEVSGELLGAILPVMDTRPGAQLIVAGTAGLHRSGLFWDTLEEGRNQIAGTGIVEFAAPTNIAAADLMDGRGEKSWTLARPIVLAAHPGIGTLTTEETISVRFAKLPLPQFMREYLGIWPEDYSRGAIDLALWRASALADWPVRPQHVAFGIDVDPGGSSAAIVAAWRADGMAFVEVVDHRPGTDWLVGRCVELSGKYRGVIGHDTVGAVLAEAEAMAKRRPAPRRKPIAYKDVGAMCATFMKELDGKRLRHSDQSGLNAAAEGVVKRPLGDSSWAWGRRQSGAVDITPLVAATIALRTFDTTEQRGSRRLRSTANLAQKARS
ncbi:ATP-binding protein [Plantibacter flavus]|uniref:terminase large subunit domain-containing protein n=1 Tax=Plantibacter flavus TaxID=150123 RepID=UPI003F13DB77